MSLPERSPVGAPRRSSPALSTPTRLGSPPTSALADLDAFDFDAISLDTDLYVTQRRQIAYDIVNGRMTKAQENEARKQYDLSDADLDKFRREMQMPPPAPGNFSRGKDIGLLEAEFNATRNSPSGSPSGYVPLRPSPAVPGPSNARSPRPPGGGGGGSPGGGSPGGGGGGGGGGSPGGSSGGSGRRRGLSQDGLRRQLHLLNTDALLRTAGREVNKVTHTNTVTTVYTDNGPPTVHRTSRSVRNLPPAGRRGRRTGVGARRRLSGTRSI